MLRAVMILAVLLPPTAGSCADTNEDTLTVFAATSLRSALEEIHATLEPSQPARVRLHTAGSGALAMQVERGAVCDVFVPAGAQELGRIGLPYAETRLLSNELVVVVPREPSEQAHPDLARRFQSATRVSLANPDAVPAGRYARDWLRRTGAWEAVEPRVLKAPDVRAALAAVESGGAQIGIVYRTDAAQSDAVRVVHEITGELAPEIEYPLVLLEPASATARRYASILRSEPARAIFRRHGFLVLADG